MISKIIFILALLFTIACSEKEPDLLYQKLDFKKEALLYIKNDSIPPPPPSILAYYEIILPINHNGREFDIIIENLVGKLVYDKYYKKDFKSYALFLEYLSTDKMSIPSRYIDDFKYTMKIDTNFYGYIKPSDKIFKEYSQKGFLHILDKYFTELGKHKEVFRYRLKNQDTTLSYNSIYKIMYDNKYIGMTDCVTGETSFFRFIE